MRTLYVIRAPYGGASHYGASHTKKSKSVAERSKHLQMPICSESDFNDGTAQTALDLHCGQPAHTTLFKRRGFPCKCQWSQVAGVGRIWALDGESTVTRAQDPRYRPRIRALSSAGEFPAMVRPPDRAGHWHERPLKLTR